jgi:chaperonin GroES
MKKNMKKIPAKQKETSLDKKTGEKRAASFGLRPLSDRVIVKELDATKKETTDSGIYIPQNTSLEKGAKRGLVVAVGPGKFDDGELVPMHVKVGDTIIFQWGDTVIFEEEEYYILKEQEIAAIVLR